MGIKGGKLELGVIVCKHCGNMIDTLDTSRVITYYAICEQPHCMSQAKIKYVAN